MPVAIRLSRVGTKHVPFYRVVVVDSRKKRDGAVLEVIGTYDALKTKLVNFKKDRFDDWVSKGAQPSDSAKKVYKISKLQEAGKLPEKKAPVVAKKAVTKEVAVEASKPAEASAEKVAESTTELKKEESVESTPEQTKE